MMNHNTDCPMTTARGFRPIRTVIALGLGALWMTPASDLSAQDLQTIGKIDRRTEALDQYLAEDAKIEVLAGGMTWSEGPVWVSDPSALGLGPDESASPQVTSGDARSSTKSTDDKPEQTSQSRSADTNDASEQSGPVGGSSNAVVETTKPDRPGSTSGGVSSPDESATSRGFLLFSDIPRNSVFRWPAEGASESNEGVSLFMRPSGYTGVTKYGAEPGSNGLTLDLTGRLILCEHGDRRVSQLTPGGGKITLVDRYEGKRLNSPNDAVVDSQGRIYFTDPPYGLPERADDPLRTLDFFGVYRLDLDGTLTLLTKQMTRPNGIGLSPDESTLYVAQSDPDNPIWMAFPLQEGNGLGEGRELMNATEFMKEAPGLPDGLVVHSDGTLFASGPGGIYVIRPDGTLIGRIFTGGKVSNCTFDDSESTLYITADDQVCRVRLQQPGS